MTASRVAVGARCVLCRGRPRGRTVLLLLCSSLLLLLFLSSSGLIRLTDYTKLTPFALFPNQTSWIMSHGAVSSNSKTSNNGCNNGTYGSNKSSSNGSRNNNSSSNSSGGGVVHAVTVVTSFVDIGEFGKGAPHNKRDWRIYQHWSSAFSQLRAPVVMYTNSDSFARHFLSVRHGLRNLTLVRRVNVSELWSFGLKAQIAAVYSGGYPKHWPNTVNADYTCVMHAKFDMVRDVMDRGFFPSRLIAWMDIGYLRNVVGKNDTYIMRPPPHFDPRRVLYGEVAGANFDRSWKEILRHNVNWVAGGFFLARYDVMASFVEQYRRAVTSFLRLHESNVDQCTLYAMFTREGRAIVHPMVEVQAVHGGWFDVGFSCLQRLNSTGRPPSTPRPTLR